MLLDLELVRTTRTRGVVCCFCDANLASANAEWGRVRPADALGRDHLKATPIKKVHIWSVVLEHEHGHDTYCTLLRSPEFAGWRYGAPPATGTTRLCLSR